MRVLPAIDLRDGACVQLAGGRYEDERIRLDDPIAVARGFRDAGFTRLHVVDLDAATGCGSNAAVVRALLAEPGLECQVGGGVRDSAAVQGLLHGGAACVVVGTRAIEDPAWLAATAARYPGRIVVAADVRGRAITTHGWSRDGGPEIRATLAAIATLPLAGALVTAVHREGALAGTDVELMRELAAATPLAIQAAGGIATRAELKALEAAGIAAAVVGMALYTGTLQAAALAEEFAT